MKICKYCGNEQSDNVKNCSSCGAGEFKYRCRNCQTVFDSPFCPSCGVKADAKAKKCPSCRTEYFTNACPSCGYIKKVPQQIVVNTVSANTAAKTVVMRGKPKSKWTAFILCLFLGFFGAHKFYEGNTKMGIVYLLTAGLFGIGWVFDTVAILFKSDPYYV